MQSTRLELNYICHNATQLEEIFTILNQSDTEKSPSSVTVNFQSATHNAIETFDFITEIPALIKDCHYTGELAFSFNHVALTEEDLSTFAMIFKQSNHLQRLSFIFSSSLIIVEPNGNGILKILEELKAAQNIAHFELVFQLSETYFSQWDQFATVLAESLANPTCLSTFTLNIDTQGILDEQMSKVISACANENCPRYISLNLSGNIFGPLSVEALGRSSFTRHPKSQLFIQLSEPSKTTKHNEQDLFEENESEDTFDDDTIIFKPDDIRNLTNALAKNSSGGKLSLFLSKINFLAHQKDKCIGLLAEAAKYNYSLHIKGLKHPTFILCNCRNDIIRRFPEFTLLIVRFFMNLTKHSNTPLPPIQTPFSLTHFCLFAVAKQMEIRTDADSKNELLGILKDCLPDELLEKLAIVDSNLKPALLHVSKRLIKAGIVMPPPDHAEIKAPVSPHI